MLEEPVELALTVRLAADLVPVEVIKVGDPGTPQPLRATSTGGTWSNGPVTATLSAPDATVVAGQDELTLSWTVTVPGRGSTTVGWTLDLTDSGAVVVAAPTRSPTQHPDGAVARALDLAGPAATGDHRLRPWVERSLGDLGGLRMATADAPDDAFFAAGVPWFLTLFGRDSIWAARMLLPLGTDLAAGTLRVLARRQGTRLDPAPARHPARSCTSCAAAPFALPGDDLRLPPLYYGTVDATPLWISLLHDAWRWGLPEARSAGCCRTWRPRSAGWPSTPTRTATASSSTSTPAAAAWPTRAGRTPATRCGSTTAGWPSRRSRWSRCRGTRTGRPSTAPRCWTPSAGPAASGWRELRRRAGRPVPRAGSG